MLRVRQQEGPSWELSLQIPEHFFMPEKPKLQTPSQTSEAGRTTRFQLCKPLLLVLPLAGALPVLVNLSAHTEFDRCLSATDIELVAVVSYVDAFPPDSAAII